MSTKHPIGPYQTGDMAAALVGDVWVLGFIESFSEFNRVHFGDTYADYPKLDERCLVACRDWLTPEAVRLADQSFASPEEARQALTPFLRGA